MIKEGYEDLFSKHEKDPLLRELDGCILWFYTPVDSNDPRGRMWSMAPFDAAAEIKRIRKENEELRAGLAVIYRAHEKVLDEGDAWFVTDDMTVGGYICSVLGAPPEEGE